MGAHGLQISIVNDKGDALTDFALIYFPPLLVVNVAVCALCGAMGRTYRVPVPEGHVMLPWR